MDTRFHQIEDSHHSWLITGQAGAGKSSLLRFFKAYSHDDIVLLASTGVAAQLIEGSTIHSFFGFHPGITEAEVQKMKVSKKKETVLAHIDSIVIDEVSMVRADWFDCLELYLRQFGKNPHKLFGGYRLLLSGDLFQLPPVVQSSEEAIFQTYYQSPFFFHAHCYASLQHQVMYLHENHRLTDATMTERLRQIREGEISDELLQYINERVSPLMEYNDEESCIILTSTHEKENQLNEDRLALLNSPMKTFHAFVEGNFPVRQFPTPKSLSLAIGAQVMFVSNDSSKRYVNGSLGKIVDIQDNGINPIVSVRLENDRVIRLEREVFVQRRIQWNETTQVLDSETVGRFIQFPIRLAWAITIHKSQGKTFQRVHIDLGKGAFSPGQVYVALSRCRSFDDISLQTPLQASDLTVDPIVQEFYRQLIV